MKRNLIHYKACPDAPAEIRERAATLMRDLANTYFPDPWKKKPNTACKYCRRRGVATTTAVMALEADEKDLV